ncbi:hypothetical protein OAW72_02745 [Alphaproteobacteria bacterium]|nr:hypothetical protein [Alphaproteobacteria bacterium]
MGLFRRNDKNAVIDRMLETKLFEYVMDEISDGKKNNGIWGQALVETEGDEKKAEATYIKLRVQSLKDEIRLDTIVNNERLRELQSAFLEDEKAITIQMVEGYRGYRYVNQDGQFILTGQPPADPALKIVGQEFSNFDKLKYFIDSRCGDSVIEQESKPEPHEVYSDLVSPLLAYRKTPTVIHFITDIGTDLKKGEIVFTLRHTSNDEEFNVRATSNLKMVEISKKTGDTVSAAGQSICKVQLT